MKRIVDLPVEAGVYTEQSARGAVGRWKDSDKIRFRYGLVEKLGGWERINNKIIGLARRLWDWTSLDGVKWGAIGTESKLYLISGNTLSDITPLRRSASLVNPFTTVITSSTVTVTDAGHGAQVGDYVQYSGAAAVGGLTIVGEYIVVSVIGTNSYTIVDDQTASSSASGGGTVTTTYDISVGLSSTSFGSGWGTGVWSAEQWGNARTLSGTLRSLRTWSLDNWGEDLIASPRDGSMYWWDRTNGPASRAVLLDEAPARLNYMIISQRDRHLFALGATDEFTEAFDPLLIRWCSTEDFGDWVPTSTNTAGDLRIFRGSKIITAVRTRGEILVFTDASVHQINFLGGSSVYGLSVAGENVTILGPNAAIEVDYRVFFMAEGDFYVYDGVLRPVPSDVRNFVYENINVFQQDKVFAGLNREFNEIWWFYPAKEATVWVESDFTSGLLDEAYKEQTVNAAAEPQYNVAFSSGGYITMTGSQLSLPYNAAWILRAGAPIKNPAEADYEATFIVNGTAISVAYGIVAEVTDLSGLQNTTADNMNFISLTVNPNLNIAQFRISEAGTVTIMDSAAASYALNALATPITLTTGSKYALILNRSGNTMTGYLWDETSGLTQQIANFGLSGAEITGFPGTVKPAGVSFMAESGAVADNQVRFTSFRSAPSNVIVNQTQRGANAEINRYVIYNYQENVWSIGMLARTAWHDRSPLFNDPYAAGLDGFLYQHEVGDDDNGAAMPAFVESYDLEIPEAGEMLMHVDQLIPDFRDLDGSVDLFLKGKKYPQVTAYTVKGPYNVTPTTAKKSVRLRARQVALRIQSDGLGDRWRMGTMRARVTPHGKRA